MILITGGGGYIGAVAVQSFVRAGYRVRVLDKFLYGLDPLESVRRRIEIVEGDICAFDDSVLDGVTAIVHLAGLSNDPTAEFNPEASVRINAGGTRRIAEAAKRKGIARFLFASSCAIYDRGAVGEEAVHAEDEAVAPCAAYAKSKRAAEQVLLDLADAQFRPVILRQGTVYGWSPRMRYDLVVNTFVKSAFQTGKLTVFCGGEMWRPLVDVQDVAQCYLACVEADLDRIGGQIFNVAYGNVRVLDLAVGVRQALSGIVEAEIVIDRTVQPVRDYRVRTDKIERTLGFRPMVTVEASVRDMAARIRQGNCADFENPRYYNIRWMELLTAAEHIVRRTGGVF